MDMNMKILISHLEKINAKLQTAKPTDQDSYDEFIRLFCNDFWDKIREYTPTAEWLKSRVIYMDSLSKREDIIGLQKSLIETVSQMRSLVCKKEYTDTLLKTRNLKAYYYLGAGYNSDNNEEQHKDDLFSLAEEALDVSSFTMFGDDNVPYFWESKAQSRLFPTGKLFDQYSKAKKVIDVLAVISKESTNPIDEETLNKLRDKYGSILKDLEYELKITPLSLHCVDYEELALLHAGYTPNSYYPEYYKNSLKLHWDNGRTYLKDIKESVDRVMDDIRLSSDYIKDTYDECMSEADPNYGSTPQKKNLSTEGKRGNFKKVNSETDDIEFGDNFFITPKGCIYKKGGNDNEVMARAQPSGYYLLKRLKSIGGAKSIGKKDFKPIDKNASFSWGTIVKVKGIIIDTCGEVISTNAENEYFYSYQSPVKLPVI